MGKTTLVIMAAGLGARFGGGVKQLEPLGPNGESILMYSVHDAIQAGFRKIVYIIREEIEPLFRRLVGDALELVCHALDVEICYAFQSLEDLPSEYLPVKHRHKPWGTGQAVLCAEKWIDGPFAVINADDYYGKESFRKLHRWLAEHQETDELCMIGFRLGNTLSENGGVTRGICRVGPDGYLRELYETQNIVSKNQKIFANGITIDENTCVSMNMWGFPTGFMRTLKNGFADFLKTQANSLNAEYLLPVFIGDLLKSGAISVKVQETADRWFGITYQEDKAFVQQAFASFLRDGVYRADLFSDLIVK